MTHWVPFSALGCDGRLLVFAKKLFWSWARTGCGVGGPFCPTKLPWVSKAVDYFSNKRIIKGIDEIHRLLRTIKSNYYFKKNSVVFPESISLKWALCARQCIIAWRFYLKLIYILSCLSYFTVNMKHFLICYDANNIFFAHFVRSQIRDDWSQRLFIIKKKFWKFWLGIFGR